MTQAGQVWDPCLARLEKHAMLKATTTILVDNEILIENMIKKTTIHTYFHCPDAGPGARSWSADAADGRRRAAEVQSTP